MASAQSSFPLLSQDKWLGSVNDFTRPQFLQYFNQVTPENAGKWGSAAGTTRTAAMRWTALDQAYTFAKTNNMKFNFHVLLWGNQQPTWMATLPPDEQLIEIKKWFAAVAARYPAIDYLQVVNEATWDPPDGSTPKNAGANFSTSGNYVQALGGANGTDGTGYDWILNAFRLARQYFPTTKLMLNDVAITGMTAATDEYLKIINILKRENLIDRIGLQAHAFEFIDGVTNTPTIPGHPYVPVSNMAVHKANLDRLTATGIPIQLTELDLDGLPVDGVAGDVKQLEYYRNVVPTFWNNPGVEGVTLWGWHQPNHWRNAQNAPIMLSNDTLKPAGAWLNAYVRGIAPVIRARAGLHARRRQRSRRHRRGGRLGVGDGPPGAADVHLAAHQRRRPVRDRAEHRPAAHHRPAAARREHHLHAQDPRQRRLPHQRRGHGHGHDAGPRQRGRRRCRRERAGDPVARARREPRVRRVHARPREGLRDLHDRHDHQHRR